MPPGTDVAVVAAHVAGLSNTANAGLAETIAIAATADFRASFMRVLQATV
jgi:hypothetical protein